MDYEQCTTRHEARSRFVDVTRNDDGTFTFTIVAEGGGVNTEFKFTTIPFFTFDLAVFEDNEQFKTDCGAPVNDVPFELKMAGYMKPGADKTYLSYQVVRSPYGHGKDQCGRDIEGKQS